MQTLRKEMKGEHELHGNYRDRNATFRMKKLLDECNYSLEKESADDLEGSSMTVFKNWSS